MTRSSPPVRVLYFTGTLGTGGSEAHLARLLLSLDRTRVLPELMLLQEGGAFLPEVRRAGVPVHIVDRRPGLVDLPRAIARMVRIVRAVRPDVLHSYGYPCDVYVPLLAGAGAGVRVVTSRRGNEPRRSRQWAYAVTNPLVDHVLCVSSATREFARRTEGLRTARCSVIANGIDLSNFPARAERSEAPRIIGTLTRLRPVKGVDLLVEAFELLGRDDLELHIAGPPDTTWGEEFVARNEGRARVRFLGEVAAGPFLRSLDVFVLPSRSEGMSNALLEAMATGVPIVATDVGGNREVLGDGSAGVLVRSEPEAIAEGISGLLQSPDRLRALAKAARSRAQSSYGLDVMVRRYEDFYSALMTGSVSEKAA